MLLRDGGESQSRANENQIRTEDESEMSREEANKYQTKVKFTVRPVVDPCGIPALISNWTLRSNLLFCSSHSRQRHQQLLFYKNVYTRFLFLPPLFLDVTSGWHLASHIVTSNHRCWQVITNRPFSTLIKVIPDNILISTKQLSWFSAKSVLCLTIATYHFSHGESRLSCEAVWQDWCLTHRWKVKLKVAALFLGK